MLTHDFEVDGALVKFKYANERSDAFNRALIIRKLSSIYGDVGVDMSSIDDMAKLAISKNGQNGQRTDNIMETLITAKIALDPTFEAAFTIYNEVRSFATLAVRVDELHAEGWHWEQEWIKATDPADKIDAAFQHYLNNADLWTAIEKERAKLDLPNGVAGALPSQLTEAQQADPLSANSAKPGGNGLLPTPKTEPGKNENVPN